MGDCLYSLDERGNASADTDSADAGTCFFDLIYIFIAGGLLGTLYEQHGAVLRKTNYKKSSP